jgi:hypothetical protein
VWRALPYCLRNDRPGAPLAGETTLMRHANVLGKAQISRLSRIPMPTGFAHRDDWGKRIVFLDVETHTRGKEARIIELGMIIRKVGAQGKIVGLSRARLAPLQSRRADLALLQREIARHLRPRRRVRGFFL